MQRGALRAGCALYNSVMSSLRTSVIGPLLTRDAAAKAEAALALSLELAVDVAANIAPPAGIPGRPERPRLELPAAIRH